MQKVRVGLVGCGGIANFHVSHLINFDDVEIVAVCDPVEERRVKMAEKVGAKRIYKNHSELYDNESKDTIDCIYICIEPTAHTDTETRAIEKGWPFVVEKPMTLDLELGDKVEKMIAEKNLITSVGFQDRYLDIVDILKEELKGQTPGLVYAAWLGGAPRVWWWLKKETCGGQLVEQNIHILDGLRWLFGEPTSVYATCSRGIVNDIEGYDTDDHSTAVITFANSVTATIVSGCYFKKGNPHSGIRVNCVDKIFDYQLRNNLVISDRVEEKRILRVADAGVTADRTFIDAVKSGDGSKIRSPYADGMKTLRLGLAANESMETGKVIKF